MLISAYFSIIFLIAVCIIIAIVFLIKFLLNSSFIKVNSKNNYFVLSSVASTNNEEFNNEYKKLTRRYNQLNLLLFFTMVMILIVVAVLCGRPGKQTNVNSDMENREIMLCLDVSGSSLLFDYKIISLYKNVIQSFSGEKIGLQFFDSSTKTVFPLTNDYKTVNIKLDEIIQTLSSLQSKVSIDSLSNQDKIKLLELLAGTNSKPNSASLIGDGLMNCAMPLANSDSSDKHNESSLILATDNQLAGESIFSLEDALNYTDSKGISVFAIYSGDITLEGKREETEFRKSITSHSGNYFTLKSDSTSTTIDSIINKIEDLSKESVEGKSIYIIEDSPSIYLYFLLIFFCLYVVVCWRIRK